MSARTRTRTRLTMRGPPNEAASSPKSAKQQIQHDARMRVATAEAHIHTPGETYETTPEINSNDFN